MAPSLSKIDELVGHLLSRIRVQEIKYAFPAINITTGPYVFTIKQLKISPMLVLKKIFNLFHLVWEVTRVPHATSTILISKRNAKMLIS